MEKNRDNLKKSIGKFPQYAPDQNLWEQISQELDAVPLQNALSQLPEYEPDGQLWDLIETDIKSSQSKRWWLPAAAVLAVAFGVGFLFVSGKNQRIFYSQEVADSRLQSAPGTQADVQFKQLAAWCETETLVCSSREYRNLKAEYEKLSSASDQLQDAIGTYNTEPELLRQYNEIEKQKTDILNEMAKMI